MKAPSQDAITAKLQLQAPHPSAPAVLRDPITETPMYITLAQLRPYDHNPRLMRNPLYEELKASIRQRGLDQPPPITRRPGEPHFIIRNGGNTRLMILNELWQDTHDERFWRINCLFRPWTDEADALLGHLAESDLHGPLSFIERALAVAQLKALYEADGPELSQRALASRLKDHGYPISQPHISKLLDSLAHLLPAIPQVLYGGLGKPQIERLLRLRRAAERLWAQHNGLPLAFTALWLETLSDFDALPQAFDLARVQEALLTRLSQTLGQPLRLLTLEWMAQQAEPAVIPAPPQAVTTEDPPDPQTPQQHGTEATPHDGREPPHRPNPIDTPPPEQPDRVKQIRQQIARHLDGEALPALDAETIPDAVWSIGAPPNDCERLRAQIVQLLQELTGNAGSLIPCKRGLGFALTLPPATSSPRVQGLHLLLSALLAQEPSVDKQPLPAGLIGPLLLGGLPQTDGSTESLGLERLPDVQLLTLFRLIRLARRLLDLSRLPTERRKRP